MSHSWRCIAALRDGQPPAPPPDARQMRRIDLEWAQRAAHLPPPSESPRAQPRSGPDQPRSRTRSPVRADDVAGSGPTADVAAAANRAAELVAPARPAVTVTLAGGSQPRSCSPHRDDLAVPAAGGMQLPAEPRGTPAQAAAAARIWRWLMERGQSASAAHIKETVCAALPLPAVKELLQLNSHLFDVSSFLVHARLGCAPPPAPAPERPAPAATAAAAVLDSAATALQAAARSALLAVSSTRGMQWLDTLCGNIHRAQRTRGVACEGLTLGALRAALAAAPHDFELVPQFWNSERHTAVYLLHRSTAPGGGCVRVWQPPEQTPDEAVYARRLLAWLRKQDRWCSEAEVLAAVPPPLDPHGPVAFFRGCVSQHLRCAVAMALGWRAFAAMRDGEPPGPCPGPEADAADRTSMPDRLLAAAAAATSEQQRCVQWGVPAGTLAAMREAARSARLRHDAGDATPSELPESRSVFLMPLPSPLRNLPSRLAGLLSVAGAVEAIQFVDLRRGGPPQPAAIVQFAQRGEAVAALALHGTALCDGETLSVWRAKRAPALFASWQMPTGGACGDAGEATAAIAPRKRRRTESGVAEPPPRSLHARFSA
jgi:hypothetical protein